MVVGGDFTSKRRSMADPNLGQIVAQAWDDVMGKELRGEAVDTRVILQTKDGRPFFMWLQHLGHTVEVCVKYKTRHGKGVFQISPAGFWRIGLFDYPLFKQDPGRSQPRFSVVPDGWEPVSLDVLPIFGVPLTKPHLEERPRPPMFSSHRLYELFLK